MTKAAPQAPQTRKMCNYVRRPLESGLAAGGNPGSPNSRQNPWSFWEYGRIQCCATPQACSEPVRSNDALKPHHSSQRTLISWICGGNGGLRPPRQWIPFAFARFLQKECSFAKCLECICFDPRGCSSPAERPVARLRHGPCTTGRGGGRSMERNEFAKKRNFQAATRWGQIEVKQLGSMDASPCFAAAGRVWDAFCHPNRGVTAALGAGAPDVRQWLQGLNMRVWPVPLCALPPLTRSLTPELVELANPPFASNTRTQHRGGRESQSAQCSCPARGARNGEAVRRRVGPLCGTVSFKLCAPVGLARAARSRIWWRR
eukprot:gene25130-biopygen16477